MKNTGRLQGIARLIVRWAQPMDLHCMLRSANDALSIAS
jgi:hypothetical protein